MTRLPTTLTFVPPCVPKVPRLFGLFCVFVGVFLLAPTVEAKVIKGDAKAKDASQMKPYVEKVGEGQHDMTPIPGGVFTMGSPESEEDRKKDEGPQIKVKIEPFWIGKYEVTWDAYQAFRDEYPMTKEQLRTTENHIKKPWKDQIDAVTVPTPLWRQEAGPILQAIGETGDLPVGDISQYAARQFTKWLSKKTGRFYRLPTEAEWEYACRAGTTTTYNFGADMNDLGKHAWFWENSEHKVLQQMHQHVFDRGYRKVGSFKPNAWGLYDMHGNVGEWVIDAYRKDHYAQLRKRFGDKVIAAKDAIAWPNTEKAFPHVIRGGGFLTYAETCRSAARVKSEPDLRKMDPQLPKSVLWYTHAFHIGFRIVRPLNEPTDAEKLNFWDTEAQDIRDALKTREKTYRIIIKPEK